MSRRWRSFTPKRASTPEMRLDTRQQFVRCERFGDKIICPDLQRDHPRRRCALRANDHNHNLRPEPFSQLITQVQTISVGQRQVEQNHVEGLLLECGARFRGRRHGMRDVTSRPECVHQEVAASLIAVDY